jgi:hypothetical protein
MAFTGPITYSPEDVTLACGGFLLSGFADGTFVKVEPEDDRFKKLVGADGEVTRTKSANRSGTITVTLLQTSNSNAVLSNLARIDDLTGYGSFDVLCKDNLGNVAFAATGWIRKVPGPEYGKEQSNREWTIDCSYLDITYVAQIL